MLFCTRGILQPASFRILLLRRHAKNGDKKCHVENARSNHCCVGLPAAIFQHVRVTPSHHGNKLQSTILAAGIALLAVRCYSIKDASLRICHLMSTMASPLAWSPICYLEKKQRRTLQNPMAFLPNI